MTMSMSRILDLPNGHVALVCFTPMHRRYYVGRYRGIYQRPTDWMASIGETCVWGRTRREAMDKVSKLTGGKFR
jgi:hypothetical protein